MDACKIVGWALWSVFGGVGSCLYVAVGGLLVCGVEWQCSGTFGFAV